MVSNTSLSVGSYVVPIVEERLVNAQGQVVVLPLVDLSRSPSQNGGYWTYKWLWRPLGVTVDQWKGGAHLRLPLMQDIIAAIAAFRRKRKRSGKWVDDNDRLVPSLVHIEVRGQSLFACSEPRRLRVNLSAEDDMKWFLAEMWKDLHPAPGEVLPIADALQGPDPLPLLHGEAVHAEAVPVPGLVADGVEGIAALQDQEPPSLLDLTDQALAAAIKASRLRLAAVPAIRNVTWDKNGARFKIAPRASGANDQYAPVRNFKKLNKRRLQSLDASEKIECLELIKDGLDEAVAIGISKVY